MERSGLEQAVLQRVGSYLLRGVRRVREEMVNRLIIRNKILNEIFRRYSCIHRDKAICLTYEMIRSYDPSVTALFQETSLGGVKRVSYAATG